MTISAKGYAAKDVSSPLTPFNSEIELIDIQKINEAYERLLKNDAEQMIRICLIAKALSALEMNFQASLVS